MKKSLLIIPIIAAILTGCSGPAANLNQPKDSQKEAITKEVEKKQIVASFYPLAFMAEQIVADKIDVINMAESTDVHAYEPSPKDMIKLNNASLVIYQGVELEPWTDDVVPELKNKGIVTLEVTHDLDLIKMEEDDEHHQDEDEHGDEHDDDRGHEEHNHGEFDPHVWLDPVLAQKMVDEILEEIIKIDSINEKTYQFNAEILKSSFSQLDKEFEANISQCSTEEAIVSHNAYSYLANRYGFKLHPITGFSPKDEPSAKVLAELKKEAAEGITHILVEENNIRRFADTLAQETGLIMLPLNPLGRGTLDPNKDFFDVMRENLNSFKSALNCK